MADGNALWLHGEAGHGLRAAERQDVVEQHGVDAAVHQVFVRMHVIVVRDRSDAVFGLGLQQDLVGDGAAKGGDTAAGQRGEAGEARCVGIAHGQHLAEFVVGHRHRHRGATRRRVLDAAEPNFGVAASDRLVDRGKGDEDELGRAPEAPGEQCGDVDVEADQFVRPVGTRLDERGTTFGIAGPAKRLRDGGRRKARKGEGGQQPEHQANGGTRHRVATQYRRTW